MTDLFDAIPSLKREVAPPGRFATLFPEATDVDLAAQLVDGLYRAKLDGWFSSYEGDPDTFEVTPDLSLDGVQLVVLYAATQFITTDITNRPTHRKYAAGGGLETETDYGASVLVERLKELAQAKKDLLTAARGNGATTVYLHDGYAVRVGDLYAPERGLLTNTPPSALL